MLSQIANFLFAQLRVNQRSGDVVIGRCDLAGAKVALIVEIDAIGDCSKPVCLRKLVHHREEFVFTVKTAGGIVANVFGDGANHGMR